MAACILFILGLSSCASTANPTRIGESSNQIQPNTIVVNGSKISYKIIGQGTPLILLQRFRGSLADWDPALLAALSASNQVVIFDSLGVGTSEGEIPNTLGGAADFVVSFMDALKIEQANILGWSLGGMTAQVLAIKHPNRVNKLILAGTTPPAGDKSVHLAPDEWTAVATKPQNSAADMAYLFYTTTVVGVKAAQESQERFEQVHQRGVETKTSPEIIMPQAIGARAYMANKGNWYEQLAGIDLPVLIANGDSDIAFPVTNSMVLHRQIPNSNLVIYPDAGHAFLFQYADQFSDHVNQFLRRE
ncbi:alpha/beta hydrolase [Arenicella chitinivorans]|uniref:Alpha/beta hydrolase n=2 Tax=Arenicella chitinivorans TaxID=1329800 RepID=A0A918S3A1_9GAMM|nr:alpha/beta hydrolase [Arenicella chitinivorans]